MAISTEAASVPLREILQEYLADLKHRVTPTHYINTGTRLIKTLAALGANTVGELQPLSLIRYRNQLRADGLASRSANLAIDNVRSMLLWALECGLIDTNPIGRIRRLPDGAGHQRCVRRAMSNDEIARFLEAAEADDRDTAEWWHSRGGGEANYRRTGVRIPQAPMWRAFLETGARWSELTRVVWGDVDCEKRTLVLRAENTKAKRRRVIPLSAPLVEVFKSLQANTLPPSRARQHPKIPRSSRPKAPDSAGQATTRCASSTGFSYAQKFRGSTPKAANWTSMRYVTRLDHGWLEVALG